MRKIPAVCCLILTIGCYCSLCSEHVQKTCLAFKPSHGSPQRASAQEIDVPKRKISFKLQPHCHFLYHELGHALNRHPATSRLRAGVKDAQNVLSVVMVHECFDEETPDRHTYATGLRFWARAEDRVIQAQMSLVGRARRRFASFIIHWCACFTEPHRTSGKMSPNELGLAPKSAAITCEDEYSACQ